MSVEAIRKRLSKLRNKMGKTKLDAVLVTKKENYTYLSGFTGSSAWLIITESKAVLVTDFRYTGQAEKQAPDYEISTYRGSIVKGLNDVFESMDIEMLGFEDANLTVDKYTEYREKFNVKEMRALGGMLDELREIKDNEELRLIKKAVEIADDTYTHILGAIKPGIAEVELAAEMEYHMRKLGASGASFETIVASGNRSSMPHGVASEKKLQLGEAITMDFGALYNGYCSDMTRTVFLGKPEEELKKIYKIVLDAQIEASAGVKKGSSGKDIDMIARNMIAKEGYGENFGHGLGHGVGLEIHEEPRLSMTGAKIMKNGMIVTVEPGIYIDGLGGVRIEDMVVVKDDRPVILTSSAKELTVI
ncbi:MAG: aminopeptidase P family protein [Ruminiclostridium sp.]|nr:aminopeptidase P family protein [Ruminiclostridium sp.]